MGGCKAGGAITLASCWFFFVALGAGTTFFVAVEGVSMRHQLALHGGLSENELAGGPYTPRRMGVKSPFTPGKGILAHVKPRPAGGKKTTSPLPPMYSFNDDGTSPTLDGSPMPGDLPGGSAPQPEQVVTTGTEGTAAGVNGAPSASDDAPTSGTPGYLPLELIPHGGFKLDAATQQKEARYAKQVQKAIAMANGGGPVTDIVNGRVVSQLETEKKHMEDRPPRLPRLLPPGCHSFPFCKFYPFPPRLNLPPIERPYYIDAGQVGEPRGMKPITEEEEPGATTDLMYSLWHLAENPAEETLASGKNYEPGGAMAAAGGAEMAQMGRE